MVRKALLVAACVAIAYRALPGALPAEPAHRAGDEATELAYLLRAESAGNLATAALLAHLTQMPDDGRGVARPALPVPSELIERAVRMAPTRPDFAWLQLRECQQLHCSEEAAIALRLRELDPQNGLARLADLRAARLKSPAEITHAVELLAAAPQASLYWNRLSVTMYDALTHPAGGGVPPTAITFHPDDRLSHVTGLLAAIDVSALKSVAEACGPQEIREPGRREACGEVMARFEHGDSVILQNMSLSVQEGWWPAGSQARASVQERRRQKRYLTVASNRLRPGEADRDAARRVEAMRRLPREEDVELEMLAYFHDPLVRPSGWEEPTVK